VPSPNLERQRGSGTLAIGQGAVGALWIRVVAGRGLGEVGTSAARFPKRRQRRGWCCEAPGSHDVVHVRGGVAVAGEAHGRLRGRVGEGRTAASSKVPGRAASSFDSVPSLSSKRASLMRATDLLTSFRLPVFLLPQ